jgi:phosphoglycerate dehydrogenase-like enzyme
VEKLLFPALAGSPALLTNARGVFSAPLAEFAIAAMLFFAKNLRRMVLSQMAGAWDQFEVEMLSGRTAGVLGYGEIGRSVAERAHALGMQVLAVRRRPEFSAGDSLIARAFGFEQRREMLAAADYVVLAAPLTAATLGCLGAREIEAMRPGAVLINIGRGPVIEERALVEALERRRIRGAALDVFDHEPLPAGHPFYRLDNVLLSPHCADHTAGWQDAAMQCFLDNFERFRRGEPLRNVVDKRAGY